MDSRHQWLKALPVALKFDGFYATPPIILQNSNPLQLSRSCTLQRQRTTSLHVVV